jgi:hypothetical protein
LHCNSCRNLKDCTQRVLSQIGGLSKTAYFIFGYFSTKLGTFVDGHEQNNNLKVSMTLAQEINGRD